MELPLALAVNDLNLTPVERSSLIKSFEQFLEYREMQANLEIKKSKKELNAYINQFDYMILQV